VRRRLLIPLSVLLIGLSAVPASAATDSQPSYYSGANTSDAYGGPGVSWVGTPNYGPGRTGGPGDRAFVVGPNGALAVTGPSIGNFGTGDFALHLYTRLDSGGGISQEILNKRQGCAGGSFLDLRAGVRFGGVYFEIQDAHNFGFHVTNSANILDGGWHEITAIRAGSRVTLTVDGAAAIADTVGVVDIDNTAPMRFGDGPCVTGPGVLGDGSTRTSGRLEAISFGPGTAIIGPPPVATTSPTPPPTTAPPPRPHPTRPSARAVAAPPTTTVSPSSAPPTAAPVATPSPANVPAAQPRPQRSGVVAAPAARPRPVAAGTAFIQSLPSPSQVSTNVADVVRDALLAILFLTLLALPIGIINDTAAENFDRLAAVLARVRRWRLPVMVAWAERLTFSAGLLVAALAGAVIYGFVEPTFRVNLASLALVLGLAMAFLVVSMAKELAQAVYLRRAYEVRGFLRLFPAFALVAVACAVVSRLIGLEPGLILGTLAVFGTRNELDVPQKGKAAAVAAGTLAVLGTLAWVLRTPITDAVHGFGGTVLGVALTGIAVTASEILAFGLLPLSFLLGASLFQWSKPVWAVCAGLGAFAFVHVLLQRSAGTFAHRITYLIILLAGYLLAAAIFWAWFRFRRRSTVEAGAA
jgi:hypothetical protein